MENEWVADLVCLDLCDIEDEGLRLQSPDRHWWKVR